MLSVRSKQSYIKLTGLYRRRDEIEQEDEADITRFMRGEIGQEEFVARTLGRVTQLEQVRKSIFFQIAEMEESRWTI